MIGETPLPGDFDNIVSGPEMADFGSDSVADFVALENAQSAMNSAPLPGGMFRKRKELPALEHDVTAGFLYEQLRVEGPSVYDLTKGRRGGSAFVDKDGQTIGLQRGGFHNGKVTEPAWETGVYLTIDGTVTYIPWAVWVTICNRLEDNHNRKADNPVEWRF